MAQLTENDCINIKYELQKGRLTIPGMRVYLIGILLCSGFIVGVSLSVATANTVGWKSLSSGWHVIYYIEAFLFAINILVLLLCWKVNNVNQKILLGCVVVFTYKTALDPFLAMSMFFKDRDNYNLFMPLVILIIFAGFLIHIFILRKWVKGLKHNNERKNVRKKSVKWILLFFIIAISAVIIRNGLFRDLELVYGMLIFTVLYIAFLIGVCEFVIALYCVFRFPSFAVNPPPQKKSQYINPKNRRKKKKRKKNSR